MSLARRIREVQAWQALDSRGSPTVAVRVLTEAGSGQALAPSGASTSTHEASFPRDGGPDYLGLGVSRWIDQLLPSVCDVLVGVDAGDFDAVSHALVSIDPSQRRTVLGGHLATAIGVASWIAAATTDEVPPWQLIADRAGTTPLIPMPMVNIVSGGAHAGRMLDLQDVLVVPIAATSFAQAIEWAWRVRASAAGLLEGRGFGASLVADEGGIAAALDAEEEALDLVVSAIEAAGLVPGEHVVLALDVAASQFHRDGRYHFDGRELGAGELLDTFAGWCARYPLWSIEDPLADDDDAGWAMTGDLCATVQVVGDDRYATSLERVDAGIGRAEANAVLVKPNQVGLLSTSIDVVTRARRAQWGAIVSARSGDTEDSWLADLATGTAAAQIKVGSTTRSERTAKWNRLLDLEAHAEIPFASTPSN